jgi:hypothetical protein
MGVDVDPNPQDLGFFHRCGSPLTPRAACALTVIGASFSSPEKTLPSA